MSPAPTTTRECSDCGEVLTAARLVAQPHAETCVPCLEKQGDVPRIKRYDEFTPKGEVVSTTFTNNKLIERQMRRVNKETAPEEAFDIALGDDSHLIRERTGENEHSYRMTEAFEEEEAESLVEKAAAATA